MFGIAKATGNTFPKEYRKITEKLFRQEQGKGNRTIERAKAFAGILGISNDYMKNLKAHNTGKELKDLLVSFENNMELLIQKTWVEKADENCKDDLRSRVSVFIENTKNDAHKQALMEFGNILDELAYLFFGEQSKKEDFTEYSFRIDAQVGLFWWFGSMLNSQQGLDWANSADSSELLAMLLLGICYLTNF